MPDLDDPEFSQAKYASYRILCADLAPRLPREHFRRGDVYMEAGQIRISLGRMAPLHDRIVWLPTLADWLEMLEEMGISEITIGKSLLSDGYSAVNADPRPGDWATPNVPTREEAAARLWMTVTSHT